MTFEDLELLCSEEVKSYIEQNIERDYREVALDKCLRAKGLGYASLIAEQVKYLQRARKKLPSYYAARCIIVGKSYEQSSSEDVATTKGLVIDCKGGNLLDMTCGLGVDSFALSKHFKRVVSVERDEVFAAVARENFRRLGAANIEVVCSSAEDFVVQCVAGVENCERFDAIYCDPDRRGADGKKKVVLEDCSPNLIALKTALERLSDRLIVKCSPLFDVDEAFRVFGAESTAVEVVSSGDECKEVVIYVGNGEEIEMKKRGKIGATAVGLGSVWVQKEPLKDEKQLLKVKKSELKPSFLELKSYKSLIIPDVSLQKARIARRVLSEVCDIWSDNGFGFSGDITRSANNDEKTAAMGEQILGRTYGIETIERYEPKRLKKLLKEMSIDRAEILKREFPYSVEQVAKQLGLKGSGVRKIAVTTLFAEQYVVILR